MNDRSLAANLKPFRQPHTKPNMQGVIITAFKDDLLAL